MEIKYINNPFHAVTITLIGAGGTGSQMLQQLGRMHAALVKLGKPGLFVCLMDDDKVTEANMGRQLFAPADIGRYKAEVLITRINRFYGTAWHSFNQRFTGKENSFMGNVIISCTDDAESRYTIHKWLFAKRGGMVKNTHHESINHYWLDIGNAKNTGQFVCGSAKHDLPTIIDKEPNLRKFQKKNRLPSCSLAEALIHQDLFINTFMADCAAKLLWEMLTQKEVSWHGAYVNIETFNIKKIAA